MSKRRLVEKQSNRIIASLTDNRNYIMSNKLPTTSKFNDDQENMPLNELNDSHRSLEPNSYSTRLEHTDLLQEILKNTIEIKNTLKDLTHRVKKLEEDNKKMHAGQLTELTITKKLITPKKETPILQNPFKTVEAFEKLEEEVKKSPELSDRLQNEIIRQEASDPSKFIRIIWRKILNDDVASHDSWKGTPKKKAIDVMAITNAFMGAFNIKFVGANKEFGRASAKWFQMAKERNLNKLKQNVV